MAMPPCRVYRVSVDSLGGTLCEVDVEHAAGKWPTVGDMKGVIRAKTGIPISEQRLFSGTDELKNTNKFNVSTNTSNTSVSFVRRSSEHVRWLQQARLNHMFLSGTPEARGVHEIVKAAVSRWGEQLQYAAPELQADRDIAMAALRSSHMALRYVPQELRADREVAAVALRSSMSQFNAPSVLHLIPVELASDLEFVTQAKLGW